MGTLLICDTCGEIISYKYKMIQVVSSALGKEEEESYAILSSLIKNKPDNYKVYLCCENCYAIWQKLLVNRMQKLDKDFDDLKKLYGNHNSLDENGDINGNI